VDDDVDASSLLEEHKNYGVKYKVQSDLLTKGPYIGEENKLQKVIGLFISYSYYNQVHLAIPVLTLIVLYAAHCQNYISHYQR
jgi:hypothetical protein